MSFKIAEYIPVGRENAVKPDILAKQLDMDERSCRRLIAEARDSGELIINNQDGRGFYRVSETDLDDIERQYRQDTSRALKILKRRKKMRKILKKAGRRV